jgi:RNA polymerase sigma-70 factor, ECF subfamily
MTRATTSPQERDLLHLLGIQARDTHALLALYDTHAALLYSVCATILPNPVEAEQTFRDGWRRIWAYAGTYNPLEGSVELWLVHVMRGRAFDRLRTIEAPLESERLLRGERGSLPATAVPTTPAREAAASAVESLPPLERQALQLAFFRAMDPDQIAARLEAPVPSVRTWLRQALDRLTFDTTVAEKAV